MNKDLRLQLQNVLNLIVEVDERGDGNDTLDDAVNILDNVLKAPSAPEVGPAQAELIKVLADPATGLRGCQEVRDLLATYRAALLDVTLEQYNRLGRLLIDLVGATKEEVQEIYDQYDGFGHSELVEELADDDVNVALEVICLREFREAEAKDDVLLPGDQTTSNKTEANNG